MSVKIPNGILDRIYEHHNRDNKQVLKFLDEHKDQANYPDKYEFKKSIDRGLHKDPRNPEPGVSTHKRIYYNWVLFFVHICGLPLKLFEVSKDDAMGRKLIENSKNKKANTKVVALFQADSNLGLNSQMENYRQVLREFLRQLKSDLRIYDYLERYEDEERNEDYVQLHSKIYHLIEWKVFNRIQGGLKNNIKYIRLLALPLRGKTLVNLSDENLGITLTDTLAERRSKKIYAIKKEVIRYCSTPLFQHICDSLAYDPSMAEPFSKNPSGFYMLGRATRAYTYACMNDARLLITEYYKYNKHKEIMLDRLFVDDGRDKDFINTAEEYKTEIRNLISGHENKKGIPKFDLKDVGQILTELIEETRAGLETHSNKKAAVLRSLLRKHEYFENLA